ncbi:MAG: DNA polymerase Y family protein [Rhizobiales bacterium]|nr:DNA polymerase Y family protein [Hyphomicrobiales bacterium]
MPRIVSVWLPRWPILRFLKAQETAPPGVLPVDPDQPFVLSADAAGGARLTAVNGRAEALDLQIGDRLADARARAGTYVQVRDADPDADADALRRLALWGLRYTPLSSPWPEDMGGDGFFLDVTGASHLFGGEMALLKDLARRLSQFGLDARCALAETPGAAWALSRFHHGLPVILIPGEEKQALSPLPIEALRIDGETSATLRRLGFKTVGTLIDRPRAPFAARFDGKLLTRLDQALGRAAEPLGFIMPPALYHARRQLLEPVSHQDAIVAIMARLMRDLVPELTRDGMGVRHLRLDLFRVDGVVASLDLGLARPSRDPAHVTKLAALKLDRLASDIDAGFGFETLTLSATQVEPMTARQESLLDRIDDHDTSEREAMLIDSLMHRLGEDRVRRLVARASHIPEQAGGIVLAAQVQTPSQQKPHTGPRPFLLLPKPEAAEVLSLLPEGPPRRFRWRGVMRNAVQADGPERIAGEWWRDRQGEPDLTRDYYVVEDEIGHRFWLYREGVQDRETDPPRWFVHGFFA